MSRSAARLAPALLIAALLSPAPATSQSAPWSVGAGVEGQFFSFDEAGDGAIPIRSLSLVTVPMAAQVGVGMVTFSVGSNWARGSLERADGSRSEISALTDTQLAATVTFGVASITGIVSAPTGHETLTDDQRDVAGLIASDLLPFRISNWGTGGGAGVRASATRRWGDVGAGVSVSYFFAREFEPLESIESAYRPGNNLAIRGAIDGNVGRAGKLSLQVSYFNYSWDASNEADVYRSGDRFQAIGSYAFAAGRRSSGVVYLGGFYRAGGSYLEAPISLVPPAPQFLFIGGAGGRLRAGGMVWIPSLDLRALRSDDGIDQGFDGRLGLATEIDAGTLTVIPNARFHLGRAEVVRDVASDYTGWSAGLTFRLSGP